MAVVEDILFFCIYAGLAALVILAALTLFEMIVEQWGSK